MTPNQSHVAGLELALGRWNEGGPAIQFANLLTDLIGEAKSAPAEPVSREAVAWAICKEPGWVDWLSATYANKRAAEAHVASYKDDLTLYITPLYAAPPSPDAELVACLKFARTTMAVVADQADLRGVEYRSLISEIKRIDAMLAAAQEVGHDAKS